ncbi:MAG: chorismate mutase [Candidatus Dojkabacteria bacterium]|nr:chorismate mutase [Candidatus Dojkabacteria bacterium]
MYDINELRKKIDEIDKQLLDLLNQRFDITRKIGRYKILNELKFYDKDRWNELLKKKIEYINNNCKNLTEACVVDIFNIFHAYSIQKQKELLKSQNKKIRVGIQGGRGSFNEQALLENKDVIFGNKEVEIVYLYTTENVLHALSVHEIDYGQFALFNILGGVVEETITNVGRYDFEYVSSYKTRISHALMKKKGVPLEKIDTVMAHPQVFLQTKDTMAKKYPNLRQISGNGEMITHSKVAELLASGELEDNIAVMGSSLLAEIFNLDIVETNLEDNKENYTFFVLVKPKSY